MRLAADGKYEEALKSAFLAIDRDMLEGGCSLGIELSLTSLFRCGNQGGDGGYNCRLRSIEKQSIALREYRLRNEQHINDVQANVGDSRAVLSVGGLAEPLSYDHKPANQLEARRIIAAGGWVEFNRVNGNLALSRALGDFMFKRNEDLPPEAQVSAHTRSSLNHPHYR